MKKKNLKSLKPSPLPVPSRPPRPRRAKPPPLPAAIDVNLDDLDVVEERDTMPMPPPCLLVVHCRDDQERALLASRLGGEGFIVEAPT